MNLLIPTNDGISIEPDFDHANKFRSLSVVNGSVESDELKEFEGGIENQLNIGSILNNNSGKTVILSSGGKQITSELHYIVIANNISKNTEKKLNENNFEVLLTSETNITNAILYYLRYHSVNESDYCCCH
jgi:predicted Fe-Mo cluster-binding NifX family protein